MRFNKTNIATIILFWWKWRWNTCYLGTVDKIGGEHNIPISTIRFKQIRDGKEDRIYLEMLEELNNRGRELPMKFVNQIIENSYTFDTNYQDFDAVRIQLGNMIESMNK